MFCTPSLSEAGDYSIIYSYVLDLKQIKNPWYGVGSDGHWGTTKMFVNHLVTWTTNLWYFGPDKQVETHLITFLLTRRSIAEIDLGDGRDVVNYLDWNWGHIGGNAFWLSSSPGWITESHDFKKPSEMTNIQKSYRRGHLSMSDLALC